MFAISFSLRVSIKFVLVRQEIYGSATRSCPQRYCQDLKRIEEARPVDLFRLSEIVGFSTTTIRALKAMESQKIVLRVLNEPYRPVAYSLTEKGKRLSELVTEIEKL